MKKPKKPKTGSPIRDQQTYLGYKAERDPQFEKGERFYKKPAAKKTTGLLSNKL